MTGTQQIPTVDISQYENDKHGFADEIGQAYKKYGFVGLKNHGISDELMKAAYDASKRFFALQQQVKDKYDNMSNNRGYAGFGLETAKDEAHPDLKEFYQLCRDLPEDSPQLKQNGGLFEPNVVVDDADCKDFSKSMNEIYTALDDLAKRVLRPLALYLGQEETFFDNTINVGPSILRAIHYPPITDLETPSVRAGAHEDINTITLLIGSNEPGLEILSRSGEWIPVTTIEGTIVCNIGDMLQRLTNHVLPSTTHRVVNPPGEHRLQPRYSLPFFCHFNLDYMIKTLDSCITPDNPNRYPEPISSGDYLFERLYEIGLIDTLPDHMQGKGIKSPEERRALAS